MVTQPPFIPLGTLLTKSEEWIALQPDRLYRQVTVRLWGQGVVQRNEVTGAEIAGARRLAVRPDQFILSRIDARNGALGLVPPELDGAVVSNDFPTFNIDTGQLLPAYLGWLSRTGDFVDLCRAASEGTTNRVRLNEQRFLALTIPLPPLAEQRRIVARIEALATQIAEARGLRQEVDDEVEALRGTLVKASIEGTEDATIYPIHTIADVRGGIQKGPHRIAGQNPVRYLTVAHVQRNKILTTDPRFFEVAPDELDRWRLCAGDVLIIEGNGSADQIGRAALFRGEIGDCVHQNHVIRVRPDTSRVEPEYLNLYLNSPSGQEAVQAQSRTTSGLRTLSVGRIKEIAIRLPTIKEQRRIVAHADTIHSRVDALKQLQAETAAELDALLPALLDRAFRGDL